MHFARKILDNNNNNNIQTTTDLIDSFAKHKINENNHTFCWLMINEVTFL